MLQWSLDGSGSVVRNPELRTSNFAYSFSSSGQSVWKSCPALAGPSSTSSSILSQPAIPSPGSDDYSRGLKLRKFGLLGKTEDRVGAGGLFRPATNSAPRSPRTQFASAPGSTKTRPKTQDSRELWLDRIWPPKEQRLVKPTRPVPAERLTRK